jgi:carbon-monoxide dehydrogenase medium subunit
MELVSFFTGPGKTALKPGEILKQINIPPIKPHTGLVYLKHATRNALEIAVVGVACMVQLDDKREQCLDARIVVGACAPTPVLVSDAKQHLVGKAITERDIAAAAKAAAGSKLVRPITDVRASDWYRRDIVEVQCRRVLEEALAKAKK